MASLVSIAGVSYKSKYVVLRRYFAPPIRLGSEREDTFDIDIFTETEMPSHAYNLHEAGYFVLRGYIDYFEERELRRIKWKPDWSMQDALQFICTNIGHRIAGGKMQEEDFDAYEAFENHTFKEYDKLFPEQQRSLAKVQQVPPATVQHVYKLFPYSFGSVVSTEICNENATSVRSNTFRSSLKGTEAGTHSSAESHYSWGDGSRGRPFRSASDLSLWAWARVVNCVSIVLPCVASRK